MATAYPEMDEDVNHNSKSYDPEDIAYNGDDDGLTAEFKHQIGLMEEEGDLSEAFKARIGLVGAGESFNEVEELEIALQEEGDKTLNPYNFPRYAKNNFSNGQSPRHTKEYIQNPLLPKKQEVDKLASLAVWLAILRFMGDIPPPEGGDKKKSRTPVMTKLFRTLEAHSNKKRKNSNAEEPKEEKASFKVEKRSSWKKIFNRSNSTKDKKDDEKLNRKGSTKSTGSRELDYTANTEAMLEAIPTNDLDLVHFIVGHGILRKDLRDEIYCQLCKQLNDNPSADSTTRGWMLTALCAGCIMASDGFIKTLRCFLRDAPIDFLPYSRYTRRILRRTIVNGPRYHPPNWLEYQATRLKKYVMLPITCSNRQVESVEADSATTAAEMVSKMAVKLRLKDSFGFSVYICIYDKVSSLGSGMDHVMDAVSECEQVVRYKGRKEEEAPWRLYFRKEIFNPWHNPRDDEIATSLIYSQVVGGTRSEEYKYSKESDLSEMVAKRWFIEHGSAIIPGKLQQELQRYMPLKAIEAKSRDAWTNQIIASFEELGLGQAEKSSVKSLKEEIVKSAVSKWPLQFSGLFEAFKISGPKLNKNDIVVAVSSEGLHFLDEPYKVSKVYKYYELVDLNTSRSTKNRGQSLSMVTVAGEEYTFISPNSETVAKLVKNFLDGLRKRSKWGIGLQYFQQGKGSTPFSFKQGDILELLDDEEYPQAGPKREDWSGGRNVVTGAKGSFPLDIIYVLPTMIKPPDEFLKLFALMSSENVTTLPRKRGGVILAKGTIGRHTMHGKESAA